MILTKDFYEEDAITVAKKLLGKVLVRKIDDRVIRCKIVETESYIGDIDKASHAYKGRRTERTEPLFHSGGISYVYFIYGLYHCFNVISDKENVASGVLVRAVEPLNNFEYLSQIRFKKSYDELSKSQRKNITNGPSKLCMALNITKLENYHRLYEESNLYIEEGSNEEIEIVETTRVGIDYAEEAIYFPWRFYIKDNKYVSKK
ncbi:MAG: DNA-3-methyladenine glycosylase [Clostridium sp.]|nr:DNA-3-methyladenine glycosylase [Clostridium sp.]